ncbi:MAG: hypothetical protein KC933_29430 [Myxococcales bacterium]|nr:hypothetical protein [Myxococcales bacterium]
MRTDHKETSEMIDKLMFPLALTFALGALAACGGEDATQTDELATELCEHLASGPSVAVTSSTVAASAPDTSTAHTRFDIALTPGVAGQVSYQVGEAGEYVFAFDREVAVALTDPSGAALPAEATERDSAACAELKLWITYDLAIGKHTLALGPGQDTEVRMVVEESGAGHTHE